ncbi:unnamed protein product [Thlaspi arvense]|uniref:J domain-containing protein n=1 Tax=Thlaspi arvense TaxID=13288 RepID=A0AAU9SYC5_THLAR|nr:unnamed protein product [Thlaspi arvense]
MVEDYYKILEVDYDATEELIRLNYRKLALKWHPDKHKGDSAATEKFQEINEAYNVLMDPATRFEYDLTGIYEIHKYTLREYLARFKGMILTCNGLGISQSSSPCSSSSSEKLLTAGHINCLRPPTKQRISKGYCINRKQKLRAELHFPVSPAFNKTSRHGK